MTCTVYLILNAVLLKKVRMLQLFRERNTCNLQEYLHDCTPEIYKTSGKLKNISPDTLGCTLVLVSEEVK